MRKNVVVWLKMKNHKGMQIEAIKFSSSEKRGTLSATMKWNPVDLKLSWKVGSHNSFRCIY